MWRLYFCVWFCGMCRVLWSGCDHVNAVSALNQQQQVLTSPTPHTTAEKCWLRLALIQPHNLTHAQGMVKVHVCDPCSLPPPGENELRVVVVFAEFHCTAAVMCTTIMVLSTIALLLRRMFVNRVKPWVHIILCEIRKKYGIGDVEMCCCYVNWAMSTLSDP